MYLPPWNHKGETYGPPSPGAYARQVAEHKDWSWQPGAEVRKRKDTERLRALIAETPVPERERQIFEAVFERGLTVLAAAQELSISVDTAKTYLKRLRNRLH